MLDQATTAMLTQIDTLGLTPMHELSPAQAREQLSGMRRTKRDPASDASDPFSVRDVLVAMSGADEAASDVEIPLRLLIPERPPSGVIVFFHGGGWMLDTRPEVEPAVRALASRTNCAAVLAGYRLAPEHPFPAAIDDAWAVLEWTASHLEMITSIPVPLIVAGDSAGGNLAAVVAARSADRGQDIALQILLYPVTDCDLGTNSYQDPSNQLMVTRDTMRWFWEQYVPSAEARIDPEASPLRRPNVAGLPPAVIVTAEHDVLRDDGEIYATRLVRAGVPVQHQRFSGQMHGFMTLLGILPASSEAIDYVAGAVNAVLASTPVGA